MESSDVIELNKELNELKELFDHNDPDLSADRATRQLQQMVVCSIMQTVGCSREEAVRRYLKSSEESKELITQESIAENYT